MANEDKAARYHRLRRRGLVCGTASGALVLTVFLVSGGSAALRTAVASATGGVPVLTLVGYVVTVMLLVELTHLPWTFYLGVTLERRYGLSIESLARWWKDRATSAVVGLTFTTSAALLVWWLLRWSPDHWWALAALAFVSATVVMAHLAPVVLLPLFYRFQPLERPTLSARLLALANRAGARVIGVFEWKIADRTRKANAALTGIGRTRRILVSDTLLAEHSDDEIEAILAHELAHHVYHDIWWAIAFEAVLIAVGCAAADRALVMFGGTFGLAGKTDVAALPLLALTGGGVSLVLLPVAHALSRAHERRADRYALDLTRNAPAFISAMRRLAAQNLAEDRTSRLVEICFLTHPSMADRIAAAHAWAAQQPSLGAAHRGG